MGETATPALNTGDAVRPEALTVLGNNWHGLVDREGTADEGELAAQLNPLVAPRTVFFVAKKAYFNQLRTSVALRRQGFRTVAVVLDSSMRDHNEGYFDHVVTSNLPSLLRWVRTARGALLHTQGWLFRYHIPVLIEAFRHEDSAQVAELMDLHAFMFPQDKMPEALPYMRRVWGPDVEATHRMQCACEQYLFEQCPGVLFPGDERMQEALGLDGSRDHPRFVNFMCYPLGDFFARSDRRHQGGEVRLAFAGGVVSEQREAGLFADAQLVTTMRPLVEAGAHIDVFNNPMLASPEAYAQHYPSHLELAEQYPDRYTFQVGASPAAITERIAGHDYGLMVYDTGGVHIGEHHFRQLVPTKFFLYLEAGLPVLISELWDGVVRLVNEYGIGAVVSEAQRKDLPALLDKLDHDQLRRNVAAAREQLSMDVQVERLIGLYGRVAHW